MLSFGIQNVCWLVYRDLYSVLLMKKNNGTYILALNGSHILESCVESRHIMVAKGQEQKKFQ